MQNMLEAALSYAGRGWLVFPLVPRGKTPLTKNGFKDASKDLTQIREWWRLNPHANIGLVTGAESGFVVLDIDEKHDGYASFDALQKDLGVRLDESMMAHTGGGGAHIYYKYPGIIIKNKAGLRPGIDIRGDGGYVVAPPSMHESGNPYEWQDHGSLEEMPGALLNLLTASPAPAPVYQQFDSEHKGILAKSTLSFIAQGAPAGTWHQAFYKAAMDLKQNNYEFEEAYELLSKATGHLDSTDEHQLTDVYNNRTPKHPPRIADTEETADTGASLVVSAFELSDAMISHISDKDKVKGTPTLFDDLDKMLGGGKRTGEVTGWHAEAKTGKNTLWHQLMYFWLEAGISMGYASRELTPETEVLPNILSLKYKENAWLSDMTTARSAQYREALKSWPLYFAKGYGYFDLDEIKRWVSELREKNVKFFWFDHLHYMLADPEDHKAASKLSKEIKTLAKELDVHIDLIIQPNKLAEGQKLSLNSIKGGSAIGQAIDNLFILERVKHETMKNVSKLTLEVARSKLCKPGHLFLQYDPDTTTFTECYPDFSTPHGDEPSRSIGGYEGNGRAPAWNPGYMMKERD